MRVSQTSDGLWARADDRLRAIDVATLPHPGFATDFMPIVVALLATAEGSAIVTENVYDGRFQFVDELARMGADVRTRGPPRRSCAASSGSRVRRCRPPTCGPGAALVLAGLVADGETVVHGAEHVDRGYPDLAGTLRSLGADVERISRARPRRRE